MKVVFGILGGLLLLSGIFSMVKDDLFSKKPALEVTESSAEDKQDALRRAFAGESEVTGDKKAYVAEGEKLFAKLEKGLRIKNGTMIASLFDAEMMVRGIQSRGLYKFSSELEIRSEGKALRNKLPSMFKDLANNLQADRAKLAHVQVVNDNQMILYTHLFYDAEGITGKYRWWLVKVDENKWAFYDYEDLDDNMRFSTFVGLAVSQAKGRDVNRLPWSTQYQRMQEYMLKEDFEKAGEAADKVLKHKLPAAFESYTRLFKAVSLGYLGEFEEGITQLDKVGELTPDSVVHIYMKANYLSALGKKEEALEKFMEYTEIIGWDSDVHESVSDAYFYLGQTDKAEEHWKKGLELNPNAYGCMASGACTLPMERMEEMLPYLEAAKYKEQAYRVVMGNLLDVGDLERCDWLLGVMKEKFEKGNQLVKDCEEVIASLKQEGE